MFGGEFGDSLTESSLWIINPGKYKHTQALFTSSGKVLFGNRQRKQEKHDISVKYGENGTILRRFSYMAILSHGHGPINQLDWQLPDIGKTIMNNILPGSLSAYTVRIGRYVILSIGVSRLFPCISVLCCVIPMDTHWFV